MDNRYYKYNCPPLMNDGRFISSYVRSKTFDQYIRNINDLEDGTNYRHFLQQNGNNILNNLKAFHRENNVCKIEGKCLPVGNPKIDNMNTYLSSNNPKNQWDAMTINKNLLNNDLTFSNDYDQDNTDYDQENTDFENFTAFKAQKVANDIYQKRVREQEQNKILHNVKPQINSNDCTFCKN